MDFDHAAQRLKKDQSKLKGRRTVEISAKAKREAEFRKKQQDRLAAEKKKQQRRQEYIQHYMEQCEASLGVKSLSNTGSTQFKATSIHGEGDKIALPPSVLQFLTESGYELTPGSPWTFRIGILNPEYSFPSSPLIQTMTISDESDEMNDSDGDSSDEEDETTEGKFKAYVDELSHKYLAYTHGTVVEFTQEEGQVGLPEPIASSLIRQGRQQQQNSTRIRTTRTVDPASESGGDTTMEKEDDEKTPGHLAWGAFDVPDLPIEVSLVQLPKGRACTLMPTAEAIENGFYNLKDIKLVLEQSLIRTRATLSIHDMVHTWHRGIKYDLRVTALRPSTFDAVICINTDIEVEFAKADREELAEHGLYPVAEQQEPAGHVLGRLNDTTLRSERQPAMPISAELLPEPPEDQSEGVCIVQIRADASQGRRRFDVRRATIRDLFAFAASITSGAGAFRLVTRFPRRIFSLDQASSTMADAGIQPGQEMFMLERV